MKHNRRDMGKDTNYLQVTKNTIGPAFIGMIAGGFCGSLGGVGIIWGSLVGTMLGVLAESAVSMRVEKSEEQPCEEDPDAKEYLLVNHHDIPSEPPALAPVDNLNNKSLIKANIENSPVQDFKIKPKAWF